MAVSEDLDREDSRLENDDLFHCVNCGIELPWQAVIIGEFGKCRQCKREELLSQFEADYPLAWSAIAGGGRQ